MVHHVGSERAAIGVGVDRLDPVALLNEAKRGSRRSLARLLSLIQSGDTVAIDAVRNPPDSRSLGITGPPGAGKSVLTDRLASALSDRGKRVAVLCIDPSSPVSGGSLLGDRMRMEESGADERIYVRSVATRDAVGSLPFRLSAMADALAHSGHNCILIETAGSGQTELGIVSIADHVLLVEGPERGDIVQAEKAGILEMADIVVVNKSDLPGAEQAASDLRSGLEFGRSSAVPILLVSALNRTGIVELVEAIENLSPSLTASSTRWRLRLLESLQQTVLSDNRFEDLVRRLGDDEISLEQAVQELLRPEDA
ncbi:MAG: GTP-binding protein [Candidatus Thermoplasmatota archaeon]|nr:GTP-binding protein [Candidatus Thermoplasmatota archaeon]